MADILTEPLQRSIPDRTHESCCWGVAYDIYVSYYLSHTKLGRALRILSSDRENDVWHGVPMLDCDFSGPIGSHGRIPPSITKIG